MNGQRVAATAHVARVGRGANEQRRARIGSAGNRERGAQKFGRVECADKLPPANRTRGGVSVRACLPGDKGRKARERGL